MKTNEQIISEQKAWIASGKIGCVFASALVKMADKIGWHFRVMKVNYNYTTVGLYHRSDFIVSIIFDSPDANINTVREWALNNGFYIEHIRQPDDNHLEGLRYQTPEGTSWVQYFGPDAHIPTRQAPYPMLTFTVKLPTHIYAKTMAKGILHLAHASIRYLTPKKCDTLWKQGFAKTKKILGRHPSKADAAKVTFVNKN